MYPHSRPRGRLSLGCASAGRVSGDISRGIGGCIGYGTGGICGCHDEKVTYLFVKVTGLAEDTAKTGVQFQEDRGAVGGHINAATAQVEGGHLDETGAHGVQQDGRGEFVHREGTGTVGAAAPTSSIATAGQVKTIKLEAAVVIWLQWGGWLCSEIEWLVNIV